MTYASCPRCGIRIRARGGITPWRCPRCLARRGAKVELVRNLQAEWSTAADVSQPTPPGQAIRGGWGDVGE
jgi:tRNA(Ile2) C34 agmatinyltransferase TiaS